MSNFNQDIDYSARQWDAKVQEIVDRVNAKRKADGNPSLYEQFPATNPMIRHYEANGRHQPTVTAVQQTIPAPTITAPVEPTDVEEC